MTLRLLALALVSLLGVIALGPAHARQDQAPYRTITLVAFECGDNCYLVYRGAGGKERRALCRAKTCDRWEQAQALPKALVGKEARARFGKAVQYDSAGNKMSTNFPSVEKLVLP